MHCICDVSTDACKPCVWLLHSRPWSRAACHHSLTAAALAISPQLSVPNLDPRVYQDAAMLLLEQVSQSHAQLSGKDDRGQRGRSCTRLSAVVHAEFKVPFVLCRQFIA